MIIGYSQMFQYTHRSMKFVYTHFGNSNYTLIVAARTYYKLGCNSFLYLKQLCTLSPKRKPMQYLCGKINCQCRSTVILIEIQFNGINSFGCKLPQITHSGSHLLNIATLLYTFTRHTSQKSTALPRWPESLYLES